MLPSFLSTIIAFAIPRLRSPKKKPIIHIPCDYGLSLDHGKRILTAQQSGVSVGDRIDLSGDVFTVIEIDYYPDADDVFIAELVRD